MNYTFPAELPPDVSISILIVSIVLVVTILVFVGMIIYICNHIEYESPININVLRRDFNKCGFSSTPIFYPMLYEESITLKNRFKVLFSFTDNGIIFYYVMYFKEGFSLDFIKLPWFIKRFIPKWDNSSTFYKIACMVNYSLYANKGFGMMEKEQCSFVVKSILKKDRSSIRNFIAGLLTSHYVGVGNNDIWDKKEKIPHSSLCISLGCKGVL